MDSINFEILSAPWPELVTLDGFAEQYSYSDELSSMIKIFRFPKYLVRGMYEAHNILSPNTDQIKGLLLIAPPEKLLIHFFQIESKGRKTNQKQDIHNGDLHTLFNFLTKRTFRGEL